MPNDNWPLRIIAPWSGASQQSIPVLPWQNDGELKRRAREFGPVGVSTLRPDLPMDVLQIDHTLVDVMVVDREHRLPIAGRG